MRRARRASDALISSSCATGGRSGAAHGESSTVLPQMGVAARPSPAPPRSRELGAARRCGVPGRRRVERPGGGDGIELWYTRAARAARTMSRNTDGPVLDAWVIVSALAEADARLACAKDASKLDACRAVLDAATKAEREVSAIAQRHLGIVLPELEITSVMALALERCDIVVSQLKERAAGTRADEARLTVATRILREVGYSGSVAARAFNKKHANDSARQLPPGLKRQAEKVGTARLETLKAELKDLDRDRAATAGRISRSSPTTEDGDAALGRHLLEQHLAIRDEQIADRARTMAHLQQPAKEARMSALEKNARRRRGK